MRESEETTVWVAGQMKKKGLAISFELLDAKLVRFERDKIRGALNAFDPFVAGILSEKEVGSTEVEPLIQSGQPEIIVNIPKAGKWLGDGIAACEESLVAWGRMGDLMSAFQHGEVRSYQRREYQFVERGFDQHTAISEFSRVGERVYRLERVRHSPVQVALIDEYELTGEHVRTAASSLESFDWVIKTNPNGGITSGARHVAESLGKEVLKWGEFMGRLNKS